MWCGLNTPVVRQVLFCISLSSSLSSSSSTKFITTQVLRTNFRAAVCHVLHQCQCYCAVLRCRMICGTVPSSVHAWIPPATAATWSPMAVHRHVGLVRPLLSVTVIVILWSPRLNICLSYDCLIEVISMQLCLCFFYVSKNFCWLEIKYRHLIEQRKRFVMYWNAMVCKTPSPLCDLRSNVAYCLHGAFKILCLVVC